MTTHSRHDVDVQALARRYLAAQLAGDRREALRLVLDEGLDRGVDVGELHLEVIQWAQREIGVLWQHNRISVAQEHLATAISQLVIAHLYRHLPRAARKDRRIVVACAEGEQHELGARIAADFLEMAGFDVRFIGANVPVESLLSLTREWRADALVLSAGTCLGFPGLERAVAAVRDAFGDAFPILAGGAAFAWSTACPLPEGVIQAGRDARGLVTMLESRLAA